MLLLLQLLLVNLEEEEAVGGPQEAVGDPREVSKLKIDDKCS